MTSSETNSGAKRFSLTAIPLILLCSLAATVLMCCVLTPVYNTLASDVVLQGKLYTALLYYFNDILRNIILAALILCLSLCVYLDIGHKKKLITVFVLVFLIDILQFSLNLLMTAIDAGFDSLIADDYFSVGLSIGMDTLLIFIPVVWIEIKRSLAHYRHCAMLNKAYLISEGHGYDERSDFFPYKKFFMLKSPVLASVFWGIIISAVLQVLSSLYYDLFFWGLPESLSEVFDIIRNYLGIAIKAALMYVFCYFVSSAVLKKTK